MLLLCSRGPRRAQVPCQRRGLQQPRSSGRVAWTLGGRSRCVRWPLSRRLPCRVLAAQLQRHRHGVRPRQWSAHAHAGWRRAATGVPCVPLHALHCHGHSGRATALLLRSAASCCRSADPPCGCARREARRCAQKPLEQSVLLTLAQQMTCADREASVRMTGAHQRAQYTSQRVRLGASSGSCIFICCPNGSSSKSPTSSSNLSARL